MSPVRTDLINYFFCWSLTEVFRFRLGVEGGGFCLSFSKLYQRNQLKTFWEIKELKKKMKLLVIFSMAGLHLGPGEHLQHIKAVCLKCRQWCFMAMTFKVLHLLVLCIKTIFFIKKSTLPETFFIFLGSPTRFPDPLPHA